MEKHSILTKGCVLLCLTLFSFCPMPTDALPTHLSRRQGDDAWGQIDLITPITDFTGGIPQWFTEMFGGGLVGTAGAVKASQFDPNSGMTISPESIQEGQPLPGAKVPETSDAQTVPATQPSEDSSFYGTPKPVAVPDSKVEVPQTQPDLGTVWVPKSRAQGQ